MPPFLECAVLECRTTHHDKGAGVTAPPCTVAGAGRLFGSLHISHLRARRLFTYVQRGQHHDPGRPVAELSNATLPRCKSPPVPPLPPRRVSRLELGGADGGALSAEDSEATLDTAAELATKVSLMPERGTRGGAAEQADPGACCTRSSSGGALLLSDSGPTVAADTCPETPPLELRCRFLPADDIVSRC
jgi:hypothetical protein